MHKVSTVHRSYRYTDKKKSWILWNTVKQGTVRNTGITKINRLEPLLTVNIFVIPLETLTMQYSVDKQKNSGNCRKNWKNINFKKLLLEKLIIIGGKCQVCIVFTYTTL